jgi:hypothetical protein
MTIASGVKNRSPEIMLAASPQKRKLLSFGILESCHE